MQLVSDISEFITAQTAVTISCVDDEGASYCFTAFYAFDQAKAALYIKSSAMTTHHGGIISKNPSVSGTIIADKLDIMNIQGIQFKGRIMKNDLFNLRPGMLYHTRHPMAVAIPGDLWVLHFDWIKYTDNAKGFGHKTIWERALAE